MIDNDDLKNGSWWRWDECTSCGWWQWDDQVNPGYEYWVADYDYCMENQWHWEGDEEEVIEYCDDSMQFE